MNELFLFILDLITSLFDFVGIFILFWSGVIAAYKYFTRYMLEADGAQLHIHESYRIEFGQRIVFALEFLVAGDMIQTVANPTFEELTRLAIIVGIRTLLSFFVSRELAKVKNIRK